jgi:hypothetical protein
VNATAKSAAATSVCYPALTLQPMKMLAHPCHE